ncbi:hypothetical protein [Helicobacter cholecystus]|uniref:hypothetical protein n=1 Tax=Helicobacter cholecystus TaxID=45498 RepID=UPI00273856B8|nr:hypothetical protein [Helicobacter cholecystus]
MRKSLNFILLLIIGGLTLGIFFSSPEQWSKKITLDVLDLFPNGTEREWVDLQRKFSDSKLIYVSKKNSTHFEEFIKEVALLPNVAVVHQDLKPNTFFQDFLNKNYFYVGTLKPNTMEGSQMAQALIESASSVKFNPLDPLGIIEIPNITQDFMYKGEPYVIIEMKSSDATKVHLLYEEFAPMAKKYGIKHYFSPLFMSVENPQLIMDEVNVLMIFSAGFFLLLYFVILRMPFLTFNMIATILFSNLIAVYTLLLIYPSVSIMSLSFGIGISNICIDYLMHHHFLGFYTQGKIRFNSPVFYGFITTLVGFFVCLFIPFPLLNQLALYAMINLGVAYLCFGFLYQKIGFASPKMYQKLETISFNYISPFYFLLLSVVLIGIMSFKISADFDLSKLDYQNTAMNEQKEFFAQLQENQKPYLFYASNINGLIAKAKEISQTLSTPLALAILPTKAEIKKRERYYKSMSFYDFMKRYDDALYQISKSDPHLAQTLSYAYRNIPKFQDELNFDELSVMGFRIVKQQDQYYAQGYTLDLQKLEHLLDVNISQTQDLITKITGGIYAPMVSILGLAFMAMVVLLAISTRGDFLNALSFILFPFACVMCYLSLTTPINIMHLFALLIVVVVSVDYGIYHTKESGTLGARSAILFSTLTTLFSFGFFLLSNTRALSSFGEVICLGMGCLLILIFLQKDRI